MEIAVGLQDSWITTSDLLTLKHFTMVMKSVTEVIIRRHINASELINSKRYFYKGYVLWSCITYKSIITDNK